MVATRSQTTSSPSAPITAQPASPSSPAKQRTIVVVGTGWAGWTLSQELSLPNTNIILISPFRTMSLTPLLASAACSIFDFRIAEEPVRRRSKNFTKYQAWCTKVNFKDKFLCCRSAIGSQRAEGEISLEGQPSEFQVQYDTLILAPGCETNTFGTPGVKEYTLFMKSVKDASIFRERILDCFEEASLPTLTAKERRDALHFVIVGGGPTGIELAAEVDDLVQNHLFAIYPHLKGEVTISVYDIADRVLGQFGKKLSEYAMSQFRARDAVKIHTDRNIEAIEERVMHVKEEGNVKFGVCVWAVGNKVCSLVDDLEVLKTDALPRIATDQFLRVLAPRSDKEDADRELIPDVYALGDAADIFDHSLPTTAEAAVQKAKWLAAFLNNKEPEDGEKFEYKDKALVAYIGRGDGVINAKHDWTGTSAWLAWRSGSLQWTRSWRRRAMIWVFWILNKFDGREIARR